MAKDEFQQIEVKSNFVKFNKVGDYIQGTLLERYKPEVPDKFGKKEYKVVIKAEEGEFHDKDGSKVTIQADEEWRASIKPILESKLAEIKDCQRMRLKMTEERPSNYGNPSKIIELTAANMDNACIEAKRAEEEAAKEWE